MENLELPCDQLRYIARNMLDSEQTLESFKLSLDDWQETIKGLIEKHGYDAKLEQFDLTE